MLNPCTTNHNFADQNFHSKVRRSKRAVAEARSYFRKVDKNYMDLNFRKVDENYIDLNFDNSNFRKVDKNYIDLNFDDSNAEYISGDELYDTSGANAYDTYDYDTNDISGDYDDNTSGDDADEKTENWNWNTPEDHINA